jgi:putative ABC transport system permease protein
VTTTRRSWLADRLFALALLTYPRAFRGRFGGEMRADFRRRESHFGLLAAVGLAREGLAERTSAAARLLWGNDRRHLYSPVGRHAMFWDTLRSDVRYAVRLAVKSPLYTTLAVVALALGIGANSAIFTVVEAVLVRPLHYDEPGRLVMVWSHNTKEANATNPVSPANFVDLRDQSRSLVDLQAFFSFLTNSKLTIDGQPEIAVTAAVSPGLMPLLGRTAALGRAFTVDEAEGHLVLSDGYWHRRFGGDPSVVGRRVTIDNGPATIIGVMPADFVFPYKGMLGPTGFTRSIDVDLWTTLSLTGPQFVDAGGRFIRGTHFLATVGRLGPGVTVDRARAGLAAIAARLEQAYPDTNKGWTTHVVPLKDQVVGDVRPALLVLIAGVALILLMACVNVANLVLARSVARQRELSVRAALGATRARLARQALTESLLLAAVGALVGLLFVRWGVTALVALAPANLPRLREVHPDLGVLLGTLLVGVLTGTIVGVVPALLASRADAARALPDAGRGAIGSLKRHRMRSALVVIEIALAVVLAVGAGLLLRSFRELLEVNPGFRAEHLLTMQVSLPDRIATPDQRRAFYAALFVRLESLPGVVSVGGTTRIPLGSTNVTATIQIQGRPVAPGDRPEVEFRRALHEYFRTMGIPVVRGRAFTAEDGPTAQSVAVINETMARRLFGAEDPIGRQIRTGSNPTGAWTTIVGIIGDVRHMGLESAPPAEMYINALQNPPVTPFVAIRTTGEPAALADLVRAEARNLDPALTLYDIRTMEQIRSASVAERRFVLLLIGAFGMLALSLAGVGVYGVMSLVVSERTQEVGVRLALGAEPRAVLMMIVRQAAGLAAAGASVGLLAAAALTPLMANQLFGVGALDPLTFVAVPVLLVLLAAAAALVPGRRAMRLDPLSAIREQ